MFKQIAIPTEEELRMALGDDYLDHWHQDKVTSWLEEKGWGSIAQRFKDQGICRDRFFRITLADLVEVLPRSITSYAERRRLLNDIRLLGSPEERERLASPAALTNISINTSLQAYSDSLPSAGTPSSAQAVSVSPTTPSSTANTLAASATSASGAMGTGMVNGSYQSSTATSPAPSHSSSDFPPSPGRSSAKPSPTRTYSPKAAFSRLRNTFLSHSSHTPLSKQGGSSPRSLTPNETGADDEPSVSPSIPRTTTPDKISKFWSSYAHWHPASRAKSQWSRQVEKDQRPAHTKHTHSTIPTTERRIQVTSDKETWYSLSVTDVRDVDQLKDLILKRMQFAGHRDQYDYFHENGDNADTPLGPDELLNICSTADHLASKRILVEQRLRSHFLDPVRTQFGHRPRSKEGHQRRQGNTADHINVYRHGSFALSTPELGHSPSETPSSPQLTTTSASPYSPFNKNQQPSPYSDVVFSASDHDASHRTLHRYSAVPSSRPVRSTKGVGARFSSDDVYRRQCHTNDNVDDSQVSLETSDAPYSRQRKISVPVVSNDTRTWARRSEPALGGVCDAEVVPRKPQSSLWAVPPKKSCPNLVIDTSLQSRSPHIVSPAQRRQPSIGGRRPSNITTRFPMSAASERSSHAFWGERPPADVVCLNMEQYFDAHDLDKEVVVQSLPPSASSPGRVRLAHTKSIRLVVREASKKYSKDRARAGSVLRRKSTKLWGQRVVEVKPQATSITTQQPPPELPGTNEQETPVEPHKSEGISMAGQDKGAVQWIRGKLIGKGSFGRVYLAFNVATGEVIAVKQVEIPKTRSDQLDAHQQDMVQALYQEMKMLRDLDHDNIVQYLGYGQDDTEGIVHIFLEYVSGGCISSRLGLHGAFDEKLVRHFTRQICCGLGYLHSRNILHRDIKAANILVEADGVCKISDFGLSKKNDYDGVYDQNSRMSLRGSVYWMAPEVVKNEPYSAKVDIWSLGCTVIEMFTGQRPWMTFNQIAALYNLGQHNTPDIPSHVSDDAKDFLSRCFIIDPQERPTAKELLLHPFCQPDPDFDFMEYVAQGKV